MKDPKLVLITGESGIGKSEIALELVRRGHRLVADDRVDVVNINKKLIGSCPELTKGVMEVRGIGIINVISMFGISSYKDRQDIDYAIELKLLDENYEFERIETSERFKNILGVYVTNIQLPVSSGRNIADLVEVAIRNELLKAQGVDFKNLKIGTGHSVGKYKTSYHTYSVFMGLDYQKFHFKWFFF